MRVRRRVSEAMNTCGLTEVSDERISVLSLGYRKRLGVADALALHPKLLLLDDPIAGLDLPHRKKIAAALVSASARSAVLVTGHEIAEMLTWCTRVVVLKEGCLNGLYRVSEYDQKELHELLVQQMMSDQTGEERS